MQGGRSRGGREGRGRRKNDERPEGYRRLLVSTFVLVSLGIQGGVIEELQKLLAEGVSQREIAKRLGIPRSTLQTRIKRLTERRPISEVTTDILTVMPRDKGGQNGGLPDEIMQAKEDLWEVIPWWRQRKKLSQVYQSGPRETMRMTYHIEPRYVELIKEHARMEGVSITDMINRIIGQFFEGGPCW
jgi:Winged helix-turn-helix DNA-binding